MIRGEPGHGQRIRSLAPLNGGRPLGLSSDGLIAEPSGVEGDCDEPRRPHREESDRTMEGAPGPAMPLARGEPDPLWSHIRLSR